MKLPKDPKKPIMVELWFCVALSVATFILGYLIGKP